MGSSSAVAHAIRAVVTTSATPTEVASSAAVARYVVVSSSATPPARGFLEAAVKKLRSLAPLAACSDLRLAPVAAWFQRDGAGYDTSGGSEVAIRPGALSHQLATHPRGLPFLVAARADEDYKSGSGDGSALATRSTSAYCYTVVTSTPSPSVVRALSCYIPGSGDDSALATRTSSAYYMVVTSTPSPSVVGNHPRALSCFIPSRRIRLYPAINNNRRFKSSWAWTPWEQKRPMEAPPSPLGVDEVVKFLRDHKATSEEELKLKDAFFEKFYSGETYDPKSLDLKLDLILHKVDESCRLAREIKGDKKWGTFVFFGNKVDLHNLVAALIGFIPSLPIRLYPAINNNRRFKSSWAWTPWEQKRPMEAPPSPLGVDEVVKFLRDHKATSEEELKLKDAFFEKFYSGETYDPKSVDLKLDLILHKVVESCRLAKEIKGDKKWGTFVFFGKKIDLQNLVAAVIGLF